MPWYRPAQRRHLRRMQPWGIIPLILGLIHAPLPEPDFHNIRHHDAPGEVCEHHDHLLRWHPGAGAAEDVAVLHWHWVFAGSQPLDAAPEQPHRGPALHAHVVDWEAPPWEHGPQLSAPARGIVTSQPDRSTSPALSIDLLVPAPDLLALGAQSRSPRAFCATFAPCAPLACLLQRWRC